MSIEIKPDQDLHRIGYSSQTWHEPEGITEIYLSRSVDATKQDSGTEVGFQWLCL